MFEQGQRIWSSFRSHSILGRSYVAAVVLFVGVLAVILGVNIRALWLIAEKSSEHEQVILRSEEAKQLSLIAQLEFKKQVQEWKNILIRGADPELRGTYFKLFEEREKAVVYNLGLLAQSEGISAEQRESVIQLARDLSSLGMAYREALDSVDLAEEGASLLVDERVRGIDRQPTSEMDALVGSISVFSENLIRASSERIETVRVSALYQCVGSALVGLLLIAYYIHERVMAERSMRRAVERAEAANEAKSLFLANMSHETRTPLNGILGMAQLLEDEELSDIGKGYLGTLRQSGEHLLGILTDIIDFSEIESGAFALEPRDVEVKAFFEGLISMFRAKAEQKSVSLELVFKAHLPEAVFIDPIRVSRIVAHLIDNALKFTEKGRVEVSVSWREYGAKVPAMLHIEIEDTGVGIPRNRLGELFEAFTQVDESSTREYGGTGLGLSICRALTQRMRGEIQASSTEGQGSLFVVRLPAEKWKFEIKTAICDSGDSVVSAPINISGIPVLLVEDNRVNQRVASIILDRYGAEVHVAPNGKRAVEMYQEHAYRLIFMDLQMPEMDGFEAADLIKKQSSAEDQPFIVALTAMSAASDRARAESIGFDGYLNKPIDVSGLEIQLSRFVATEKQRSDLGVSS